MSVFAPRHRVPHPRRLIGALMLALTGLTPAAAHAAPDCDPRSIVGRAVGGEILNQLLGGMNDILGAAAGVENGISPTPSSLMGDCILPALNPPPRDEPGEDPSPVRRPAGGWGDPHLISHDGLGFDFQGGGDYAYVESDDLVVQARQVRIGTSTDVSRLDAVAIRFDDRTLVIGDPIDPSVIGSAPGLQDLITVDGEDLPIGLGGWIDLDERGSFVMRLRDETYVRIAGRLQMLVRHGGTQMELVLDDAFRGAVSGVLGNFDGDPSNDLRTAAGTSFSADDTDTLYGAFVQSWLREGEASLFNSPFDPSVGGDVVPAGLPTLSDVALSIREEAAGRCAAAGVPQGFTLHGCIYDTVFDEDDRWPEEAADIAGHGLGIVPASALASADRGVIPLGVDARVSPGVPTPDAGNLGVAGEVDRYSVTVPTGAARVLLPLEPCSGAQVFSLLLDPDGVAPAEHALTCGTPVSLPSGRSTLSVFGHGGDTGRYAFDIVEPATTDLGVIALDTVIEGDLDTRERLVATLPGVAGDRIFVATRRDDGCGRRWELVGAGGAVVDRTSTCLDLGLHVLEGDAPYTLRIRPGADAAYGFVVWSVGADSTGRVEGETRFDLVVSTPGQRASATFALTAGDRIYIDRDGGVGSGTLILTGPDSDEVARTRAFEEDLRVDVDRSGDHTLTLEPEGDFTGTVPITLVTVADDTDIDVSRGETFTLTLSTLGQRATASIDVAAGETLTVTQVSTDVVSGIAATPVIQPPGDAAGLAVFGSRTVAASVGGTYRVVVESSEGNRFIGSMTFEVN